MAKALHDIGDSSGLYYASAGQKLSDRTIYFIRQADRIGALRIKVGGQWESATYSEAVK